MVIIVDDNLTKGPVQLQPHETLDDHLTWSSGRHCKRVVVSTVRVVVRVQPFHRPGSACHPGHCQIHPRGSSFVAWPGSGFMWILASCSAFGLWQIRREKDKNDNGRQLASPQACLDLDAVHHCS